MFVAQADGEAPWATAVRCASATLRNKVVCSEDDLVGLLFYNTVPAMACGS